MDLADLLGDNSSTNKPRTGRRSDFLSALQKSRTTDIKNSSEEIEEPKRVIEIDHDVDVFNRDAGKNNNNEKDKVYAKSGNNFFNNANNSGISNIGIGNKINESDTNLNRRKSNLFPESNENLSSQQLDESESISNNSYKRADRKNTSSPVNVHPEEDDGMSNVYVPSLSRNSRRSRIPKEGLSLIPESNSRVGSNEKDKKEDKKEDITSYNFRDQKEKENNITKDESYQPKTLLKSRASVSFDVKSTKNEINTKEPISKEPVSPTFNQNKLVSQANTENLGSEFDYKSFGKQDTSVSFRNKNESPSENNFTLNQNINPTNDYRSASDKEYLESQLNSIKQRSEDDKNRYESLLTDEKEKTKRKEQDLNKFIDDLKQRHKHELKSNEEKNRTTYENLNFDIKKLRSEIENEIIIEKERLSTLHKSDLENQENINKRNLENQKKFFEEQNETLKKQLQQQIEFNKLANKVEVSSKQIEEILHKFYQEKDKSIETEKSSLDSKEKHLSEWEEKILDSEKMLIKEKEVIMNMRKDLELRDVDKKKELQEDKSRIEKDAVRLQELQNSVKTLEFNLREKYEREKLELEHKHSELKSELELIKSDSTQRINDLEYSKKLFEEEKRFFEKFKDEALKNVELKKANLEERRKAFNEEEREIKGRIKVLQEKEFYLSEKFEEFERLKADNDEMTNKTEKDRKELMIAAKRLHESIHNLDEKNKTFEQERDEVVRKYQELEAERNAINSEKAKIEQAKAELRLRLQSVDILRIKYVTSNMGMTTANEIKYDTSYNNFNSNSSVNPFAVNMNMNMNNTNNNLTHQRSTYKLDNNYMDNKLGSTIYKQSANHHHNNSDEHLQNLKSKLRDKTTYSNLSNHGGDFNSYMQQEKENLRTSKESFENTFKKDYERQSQLFLSTLQHKNNSSSEVRNHGHDINLINSNVNKGNNEQGKIQQVSNRHDTETDQDKEIILSYNATNFNKVNNVNNVNKVNKVDKVNNKKSKFNFKCLLGNVFDDYDEIVDESAGIGIKETNNKIIKNNDVDEIDDF